MSRTQFALSVAAAGIVSWVVIGCSSGDGDSGGSGGDCVARCDVEAKAACPADTRDACLANCNASRSTLEAQCGPEFSASNACFNTLTLVCSATGHAVAEDWKPCEAQARALLKCGVCIPTDSQGPCFECTQHKCCAELNTMADEPTYFDYLDCLNACGGTLCELECRDTYPAMGEIENALNSCAAANCATECS